MQSAAGPCWQRCCHAWRPATALEAAAKPPRLCLLTAHPTPAPGRLLRRACKVEEPRQPSSYNPFHDMLLILCTLLTVLVAKARAAHACAADAPAGAARLGRRGSAAGVVAPPARSHTRALLRSSPCAAAQRGILVQEFLGGRGIATCIEYIEARASFVLPYCLPHCACQMPLLRCKRCLPCGQCTSGRRPAGATPARCPAHPRVCPPARLRRSFTCRGWRAASTTCIPALAR